ncbi:mucin-5AC [Synchiropus splendidus]|uniref:mucin-5AC n=1 Tax=Synchiropus splendidus TaxID=270530 RepID=UPI00237E3EEB|nr:mucin-5AC [Synchiropus splendidus]
MIGSWQGPIPGHLAVFNSSGGGGALSGPPVAAHRSTAPSQRTRLRDRLSAPNMFRWASWLLVFIAALSSCEGRTTEQQTTVTDTTQTPSSDRTKGETTSMMLGTHAPSSTSRDSEVSTSEMTTTMNEGTTATQAWTTTAEGSTVRGAIMDGSTLITQQTRNPDTTATATSQTRQTEITQNIDNTASITAQLPTSGFKSTGVMTSIPQIPTTPKGDIRTATITETTDHSSDKTLITQTADYNSVTTTVAPTTDHNSETTTVAPTTDHNSETTTVAPTTDDSSETTTVAPTTDHSSETTTVAPTKGHNSETTTVAPTTDHHSETTSLAPTTDHSSETTTVAPTTDHNSDTTTVTPTNEHISDATTVAPTTDHNSETTSNAPTTDHNSDATTIAPTTDHNSDATTVAPTTDHSSDATTVAPTTDHNSDTTTVKPTTDHNSDTTSDYSSDTTTITPTSEFSDSTTLTNTTDLGSDTTTITATTDHDNNQTSNRATTGHNSPTTLDTATSGDVISAFAPTEHDITSISDTSQLNNTIIPTTHMSAIATAYTFLTSGPASTAGSPTSNSPASTFTTATFSDATILTPTPPTTIVNERPVIVCPAAQCPLESICVNGTCQCLAGHYLLVNACVRAQVFPGQLHLTSLQFHQEMSNRSSSRFRETAASISAELRKALKSQAGYIRSDVAQLQPGSVLASVNNIFENTEASQESVEQSIHAAIARSQGGLLLNAAYNVTDLCQQQPMPCDPLTTKCLVRSGLALCTCKEGYISILYSNISCAACPSGQMAVRDKCEPCAFGRAGFNCDDTSLMAVVVVSCVLGGVLILLLALIVCSCRSRSDSQSDIGLSPYPTGDLSKPWPTGVTPIPRATTKWDGAASIEMAEGGSSFGVKKQTNGLSGSYDLHEEGMKTFKGKNTSRYSYLVQGHENPYFLPGDERKE